MDRFKTLEYRICKTEKGICIWDISEILNVVVLKEIPKIFKVILLYLVT